MKFELVDGLIIFGWVTLSLGVGLISPPWALIVAGGLSLGIGLAGAWRRSR